MALTVNTPGGRADVPGGMDFVVDWPDQPNELGPGLAILDKPESDNTARFIAYYAPGQWLGVVNLL